MRFLGHLSRTVRGRSLAVSRPLVLAGVAVLALTPLASAVPAGATPSAGTADITLFGGVAKFSVGGHTWQMSVFDFSVAAGISISATHEFDTWNFLSVPKSDLTANVKRGTATFSTHNALAPVAFANLRFTPSSRHKTTCRSGSETVFDGKLTGSITLVASKRLKFKSAHVVFRASSLGIDHHCVGPSGPSPCFDGVWDTVGLGAAAAGDSLSLPAKRTFSISLSKTVQLRAPKEASASYQVFGAERKPVFDIKRKRLSVSAIRVVKGSAVMTASMAPVVTNSRCTIGRTHFRERDASYSGSYTSPAGFSARSIVGGLLKVGRKGGAFFDITTFKRA